MINLILSFLWAFLISVFAIPSIIDVAHRKNLLDRPHKRRVHLSLTPRLGGLAIFAGFTSSVTIFGLLSAGVQHLLASCIIIFFIGLKDDIVSVSAFKKFFVQILATGIIVFMADLRITNFQGLLGIYELDEGMSYAFTGLVIIGITNSINLLDGLDGLAGTIIFYISLFFAMAFSSADTAETFPYACVALSLSGSLLGFLRYNFHKAKIFMGDTGSLVSGFIIAVLAIKFIELSPLSNSPAQAASLLFIPLFDTVRVFFIRVINGKSPFAPDMQHIHHRLIGLGLPQQAVVIILLVITMIVSGAVYYFNFLDINWLFAGIFVLALLLFVLLSMMPQSVKPADEEA